MADALTRAELRVAFQAGAAALAAHVDNENPAVDMTDGFDTDAAYERWVGTFLALDEPGAVDPSEYVDPPSISVDEADEASE